MTATTRTQWIADARALLDLIEANPDVPTPYLSLDLTYYPQGTDEEERAGVEAVAAALGTEVVVSPTGRCRTTVRVGSASYSALAITEAEMDRHHAVQRLGTAALAAVEQEVSA